MSIGATGRPAEILLVEDNPGDVLLIREALKEVQVAKNLRVVRNGVEATEFLRQEGKFAGMVLPDIILMDLNVPGIDGRELLKETKTAPRLKGIPIVVLTTSSAPADIITCYELHANGFITKPLDLEQFFRAVRSLGEFWLNIVSLPSAVAGKP